jgi:hypothetical protein
MSTISTCAPAFAALPDPAANANGSALGPPARTCAGDSATGAGDLISSAQVGEAAALTAGCASTLSSWSAWKQALPRRSALDVSAPRHVLVVRALSPAQVEVALVFAHKALRARDS